MVVVSARGVFVVALVAGCGRIGFDELTGQPEPVRSTLRLDLVAPAEALVDFPLPVTLDDTRADLVRLDPETLRFYADDGRELPHEIETLGPPLVAWVLVPSISGTTTSLLVEYGGLASPEARVFGSDYAGVWHMAGRGALVDASPFARDGETTGTRTVRGLVGDARDYVPLECAVVRAFQSLQLPASVTMSAWMWHRTPRTAADYAGALTKQKDTQVVDDFYVGTNGMTFFAGLATNPTGTPTLTGTMQELGAWHRIAYAYDGTQSTLYVDDVAVANGPAGGTPLAGANPLFIGCGHNGSTGPFDAPDNDWIDGMLDEVRIETVARSTAWLVFEHAAHRDQVISYGPIDD